MELICYVLLGAICIYAAVFLTLRYIFPKDT
jgi:hypothetical protein